MKEEKFPELSKWVKDSMNCDPHIFAEGELEGLRSELDTVGVQYPVDFMNEKPSTPQDDPNDLREKPSGGANNMPPEKTVTPPAPKVELKPQPNYKPAATKPVPVPTTIPVAPKPAVAPPPPSPSTKQPKNNIGN
jgi:hypothetical protein